MWESGKVEEVGFVALNGTVEWGVASAEGTGSVWESASGTVVSAAGEGTVDSSAAAGGQTDGGVSFAASVALEPRLSVMVVLRSSMWAGFPHRCNGEMLPWGSEVPLKTNPVEAPRRIHRSILVNTKYNIIIELLILINDDCHYFLPTSLCWHQPPNSCWICLIWLREGLWGVGSTVSFVQLSTSLCSSSVNVHFLKGLLSAEHGVDALFHNSFYSFTITECVELRKMDKVDKANLTISQHTVPSLAGSGSEVCCSGLQQWGSLLCSLPEKLLGCCMPTCRKNMTPLQKIKVRVRGESVGVDPGHTWMCDTIVIHVRMRPGPKLAFGWPVPTRREDSRRCGKRCSWQWGRQTLPLVFKGTKLSV